MSLYPTTRHPILIFGSAPSSLASLGETARFSIVTLAASDADRAVDLVAGGKVALVLFEWRAADTQRLSTLRKLHAAAPLVPIILFGEGQPGEADAEVSRIAYDCWPLGGLTHEGASTALIYAIRHAEARASLKTAEAQVQELGTLKSDFLAHISHEIRTPLNGVIGMTSLLLQTNPNEEQRGYIETLKRSGNLLLNLLNSVLDFTKMEAGKFELEETNFEPREVIEDTMQLFSGVAKERGLVTSNVTRPEVPSSVSGDSSRLRQILGNLISNAIKFTERGHVIVRAMLELDLGSEVVLRFEVSDTGIGLSSEQSQILFQPFSQVRAKPGRPVGTGLGLSISKRLAELMGGSIGVSSEPGQGSTFWFTIKVGAWKGVEHPRGHLIGRRALILTADVRLSQIIQELLQLRGMVTERASDTKAAVAIVKRRPTESPDLVIIDTRVSGGVDWKPLLKKDGLGKQSTIPLMALVEGAGGKPTSQKSDFSSRLRIPVRQSQLYAEIARLIGEACPYSKSRCRCPVETPVRSTEATSKSNGTKRILVADDNPINQEVLAQMLRKLGYRVDVVSNGKQAVEAAKRVEYAGCLLDCRMPLMDGYTAATEIRKLRGADLPILAITANAMADDRERCRTAGMNGYFVKPITFEDVEGMFAPDRRINQSGTRRVLSDVVVDETVLSAIEVLGPDDHGESILGGLIDSFLRKTPAVISNLSRAMRAGDFDTTEMLAHRLKGSCANLGAHRMFAVCQKIEEMAQNRDLQDVEVNRTLLKVAYEKVRDALLREWRKAG